MAIVVASGTTLSVGAGAKSDDQVTGRNQYLGKGRLQLIAAASAAAATGIHVTLNVGGVSLMDDQLIPYKATTGEMSAKDHMLIDQMVGGGRAELFFRNDSGGALTVDYLLLFTP